MRSLFVRVDLSLHFLPVLEKLGFHLSVCYAGRKSQDIISRLVNCKVESKVETW